MPIWFIIAGIAIFAAGAITATIMALKGTKLAVLGEGRVGKTVLINFLTKGILSEQYVRTVYPEETEANDFKLKDLKLRLEESMDVPGSEDFY